MYTYSITVDGYVSKYSLTLEHLRGIYTYVHMNKYTEGFSTKGVEVERLQSAVQSYSSSIVSYRPSIDEYPYEESTYDLPMKRPLEYWFNRQLPFSQATKGPEHFSSYERLKGLILTYFDKATQSKYGYTSIVTNNLSEFLGGFLLIDLILTRSQSLKCFIIRSSQEDGYVLISPLANFPLVEYPNEIIEMITQYYPCDWMFVSRRLYALAAGRRLLDPRYAKESLIHATKILDSAQVSDNSVRQIAELIRTAQLQNSSVSSILERIDYSVKVYPEIVDAIIDRYGRQPDGRINLVRGIRELELEKEDWSLFQYLINNLRYSDIMYFDVLDKIVVRNKEALIMLIQEGFEVIEPDYTFIRGTPDNLLVQYTQLVLDKKGIFEKGPTNPKTRTYREGYHRIIIVDLLVYTNHVVELSVRNNKTETLRLLASRVDELPDGDYIPDMITIADDFSILHDTRITEKLYRKLLLSQHVRASVKDLELLNLRIGYAQEYGYSQEFVNRILSLPRQ